mmetsp:Transcript_30834/g.93297  ORF Transcript_30834/g.93297 Transcript_30834/m.93297 type:complete len:200 (-) Transcript_30834:145-744(-)
MHLRPRLAPETEDVQHQQSRGQQDPHHEQARLRAQPRPAAIHALVGRRLDGLRGPRGRRRRRRLGDAAPAVRRRLGPLRVALAAGAQSWQRPRFGRGSGGRLAAVVAVPRVHILRRPRLAGGLAAALRWAAAARSDAGVGRGRRAHRRRHPGLGGSVPVAGPRARPARPAVLRAGPGVRQRRRRLAGRRSWKLSRAVGV